jgi:hypothetical protein
VVWVLQREDLHAPGLAALGLPPHRLIYVSVRNDEEALAALEDALRTRGVAAAWGEIDRVDLVAGRRLQLACEAKGATGFVLRRRLYGDRRAGQEEGSAAATRWSVAPAPSDPGEAPGLGPPRWRVRLERCRGGGPGAGSWRRTMRRILSVWSPNWPITRWRLSNSGASAEPFALVETVRNARRLAAVSEAAGAAGAVGRAEAGRRPGARAGAEDRRSGSLRRTSRRWSGWRTPAPASARRWRWTRPRGCSWT